MAEPSPATTLDAFLDACESQSPGARARASSELGRRAAAGDADASAVLAALWARSTPYCLSLAIRAATAARTTHALRSLLLVCDDAGLLQLHRRALAAACEIVGHVVGGADASRDDEALIVELLDRAQGSGAAVRGLVRSLARHSTSPKVHVALAVEHLRGLAAAASTEAPDPPQQRALRRALPTAARHLDPAQLPALLDAVGPEAVAAAAGTAEALASALCAALAERWAAAQPSGKPAEHQSAAEAAVEAIRAQERCTLVGAANAALRAFHALPPPTGAELALQLLRAFALGQRERVLLPRRDLWASAAPRELSGLLRDCALAEGGATACAAGGCILPLDRRRFWRALPDEEVAEWCLFEPDGLASGSTHVLPILRQLPPARRARVEGLLQAVELEAVTDSMERGLPELFARQWSRRLEASLQAALASCRDWSLQSDAEKRRRVAAEPLRYSSHHLVGGARMHLIKLEFLALLPREDAEAEACKLFAVPRALRSVTQRAVRLRAQYLAWLPWDALLEQVNAQLTSAEVLERMEAFASLASAADRRPELQPRLLEMVRRRGREQCMMRTQLLGAVARMDLDDEHLPAVEELVLDALVARDTSAALCSEAGNVLRRAVELEGRRAGRAAWALSFLERLVQQGHGRRVAFWLQESAAAVAAAAVLQRDRSAGTDAGGRGLAEGAGRLGEAAGSAAAGDVEGDAAPQLPPAGGSVAALATSVVDALIAAKCEEGAVAAARELLALSPRLLADVLGPVEGHVLRARDYFAPGFVAGLAVIYKHRPAFLATHASELVRADPSCVYSAQVRAALIKHRPEELMPFIDGSVTLPPQGRARTTSAARLDAAMRQTRLDVFDGDADESRYGSVWVPPPSRAHAALTAQQQARFGAHLARVAGACARTPLELKNALMGLPDLPREVLLALVSLEQCNKGLRDAVLNELHSHPLMASLLPEVMEALDDERASAAAPCLEAWLLKLSPGARLTHLVALPVGRVGVAKRVVKLLGGVAAGGGAEGLAATKQLLRMCEARPLHEDVHVALLTQVAAHAVEDPSSHPVLMEAARSSNPKITAAVAAILQDLPPPCIDSRAASHGAEDSAAQTFFLLNAMTPLRPLYHALALALLSHDEPSVCEQFAASWSQAAASWVGDVDYRIITRLQELLHSCPLQDDARRAVLTRALVSTAQGLADAELLRARAGSSASFSTAG